MQENKDLDPKLVLKGQLPHTGLQGWHGICSFTPLKQQPLPDRSTRLDRPLDRMQRLTGLGGSAGTQTKLSLAFCHYRDRDSGAPPPVRNTR